MTARILIVEDDIDLADALADTLRLSGYETCLAADGYAALQAIDKQPVDMVLTDVQMRPMDGYTLLRQLRSRRSSIPALVMTAYGTVERAVEAMKLGAVDYLAKPFEATALIEKQFLMRGTASSAAMMSYTCL